MKLQLFIRQPWSPVKPRSPQAGAGVGRGRGVVRDWDIACPGGLLCPACPHLCPLRCPGSGDPARVSLGPRTHHGSRRGGVEWNACHTFKPEVQEQLRGWLPGDTSSIFIIQQAIKCCSNVSPAACLGEGILRAGVAPESSSGQGCMCRRGMDVLRATRRTHCHRRW